MLKRTGRDDLPGFSVDAIESKETLQKISGAVVGMLMGQRAGQYLVEYRENQTGDFVVARSVVEITEKDVGREVVLLFEQGCPDKPIIMGVIQPQTRSTGGVLLDQILEKADELPSVTVDEERIELSANREVVLRCGKASITLTRAGKVLIRGEYVLTRATGVNRVKGGSVQIN